MKTPYFDRKIYFEKLMEGRPAAHALFWAIPIPDMVDRNIKIAFLDGYFEFRPKFFKN